MEMIQTTMGKKSKLEQGTWWGITPLNPGNKIFFTMSA